MRKLLIATFAAALALPGLARAQSSPNLAFGQVPTPAQWNSYFANKQDYLGAPPCIVSGCSMLGELTTAAPTTAIAGFNLTPGTAPTTPNNGDLWTTSSGIFVQINGSTVQLFGSGSAPTSGTVLQGGAGTSSWTATPVLGVAGTTLGSVGFNNLSTGSVTLQAVTGALGTVTASLPANTGTIAETNLAQTWSAAQSFNSGNAKLNGATSGTLTVNCAATCGTSTLTLPGGTTDFSSTGGASQVVKQTSSGAPLTVGQLAVGDLSSIAANTIVGQTASGSPVALTINGGSSCTNALTWVNGTGFGCNNTAGTGTVTQVICDNVTITSSGTCPPRFGYANCTVVPSVSGNNVTFALKDNAGADPSASSPCTAWFRSTTSVPGAGSAQWVVRSATAAASVVLNSGSTLGVLSNNQAFNVWFVLFDNGSNPVLGVIVASTSSTTAATIFALDDTQVQSTTACNACASATSAGTFYTTSALTSEPFVIIGYSTWGSGLATTGTWASNATLNTQFTGRKPGDRIQTKMTSTTTAQASTSSSYQSGTSVGTGIGIVLSITPRSAANLVRVSYTGSGSNSVAATSSMFVQIGRGTSTMIGTENEIGFGSAGGADIGMFSEDWLDGPNTASSTTYSVKFKNGDNATNMTWPRNPSTSAVSYGRLTLEEVQG